MHPHHHLANLNPKTRKDGGKLDKWKAHRRIFSALMEAELPCGLIMLDRAEELILSSFCP